MDILYRLGSATAAEIHAALPDAPTYTTVRGLLRILHEKGHVRYVMEGKRYVYSPSTPRRAAGVSSLTHVVKTFFGGSPTDAMAALLGSDGARVTDAELDQLASLVADARRRNRPRR